MSNKIKEVMLNEQKVLIHYFKRSNNQLQIDNLNLEKAPFIQHFIKKNWKAYFTGQYCYVEFQFTFLDKMVKKETF